MKKRGLKEGIVARGVNHEDGVSVEVYSINYNMDMFQVYYFTPSGNLAAGEGKDGTLAQVVQQLADQGFDVDTNPSEDWVQPRVSESKKPKRLPVPGTAFEGVATTNKKPKRSFVQEFIRTVERRMPSKMMSESYYNLDAFTRGYLEAALWGRTYATVEDVAPDELQRAIQDCRVFQEKAYAQLARAGEAFLPIAGADFWYARRYYGVDYFDRFGNDSDFLNALARSFPEMGNLQVNSPQE